MLKCIEKCFMQILKEIKLTEDEFGSHVLKNVV